MSYFYTIPHSFIISDPEWLDFTIICPTCGNSSYPRIRISKAAGLPDHVHCTESECLGPIYVDWDSAKYELAKMKKEL